METQQLAEKLYCTSKLSQDEISTLVGINRKTLYNWAKEKNWQRQPQAEEAVPLKLLSKCYNQIDYLLSESEYVDPEYCQHHFKGISVMIRAVNSLKPKLKESTAATVMSDFMKMVNEGAPGLAMTLLPVVQQFIESKNLDSSFLANANPKSTIEYPDPDQSQIKAPKNKNTRNYQCATPKKQATPKSIIIDKSSPINQNNHNNHQTTRTQDPLSTPTFGVHGASDNNNNLLQNNAYNHITNNLPIDSSSTAYTGYTPFSQKTFTTADDYRHRYVPPPPIEKTNEEPPKEDQEDEYKPPYPKEQELIEWYRHLHTTPTFAISLLRDELDEIQARILAKPEGKRFASPAESLVRNRIVDCIKKLDHHDDPEAVVDVMLGMLTYLSRHDPESRASFRDMGTDYLAHNQKNAKAIRGHTFAGVKN